MRTLARIAMIAVAAAVFMGLTAAYVRYSPPPPPHRRRFEEYRRRRPSGPAMRDLPSFLGEFLLVGGIALVGRKVLQVKL
jgi:hypothetical protein